MNLEKQVVSLELAKKLKELGVKQESLFWWCLDHEPIKIHYRRGATIPDYFPVKKEEVSAFTIAELGEIMKDKGMGVTAHTNLVKSEWWVRGGEWIVEKQKYSNLETDERWADALAKMLISLIKNKLI